MGRKKTIEDLNKYKTDYNKGNYDSFLVRVKKGEKEVIETHAKARGKSLNGFVNEAIKEKIEREN